MSSQTLIILHGENQVASRKARSTEMKNLTDHGFQIRVIEGESTTRAELESNIHTISLFEQEGIVIDNLLSRLKSKEKQACIDLLTSKELTKPIILWEKRALTPTMIKPFSSAAKVQIFKESSTLFPFIDSLKPGNQEKMVPAFHKALDDNDVFLIFGMIVRRITDLLIASDDSSLLSGSPWGVNQVISQSKSWTTKDLLITHKKLLDIDISIKTGNTKLDLTSQLDLLLLTL